MAKQDVSLLYSLLHCSQPSKAPHSALCNTADRALSLLQPNDQGIGATTLATLLQLQMLQQHQHPLGVTTHEQQALDALLLASALLSPPQVDQTPSLNEVLLSMLLFGSGGCTSTPSVVTSGPCHPQSHSEGISPIRQPASLVSTTTSSYSRSSTPTVEARPPSCRPSPSARHHTHIHVDDKLLKSIRDVGESKKPRRVKKKTETAPTSTKSRKRGPEANPTIPSKLSNKRPKLGTLKKRLLSSVDTETSSPVSGMFIKDACEVSEQELRKAAEYDDTASYVNISEESRRVIASIPNCIGDSVCSLCKVKYEDVFRLAMHRCPRIVHEEYRCPDCEKLPCKPCLTPKVAPPQDSIFANFSTGCT